MSFFNKNTLCDLKDAKLAGGWVCHNTTHFVKCPLYGGVLQEIILSRGGGTLQSEITTAAAITLKLVRSLAKACSSSESCKRSLVHLLPGTRPRGVPPLPRTSRTYHNKLSLQSLGLRGASGRWRSTKYCGCICIVIPRNGEEIAHEWTARHPAPRRAAPHVSPQLSLRVIASQREPGEFLTTAHSPN
ncbi:hypothetical protein EVAR_49135_1 [Eumeta japonica]|uniref:Uncharacterized protein n=1 Tax=Eumeta variegata TaxID=151549 RepID=A0A4C1ZB18_EUMVA|nr:hypothetical protein EVAR_49135_1 [Eumeta japonica]